MAEPVSSRRGQHDRDGSPPLGRAPFTPDGGDDTVPAASVGNGLPCPRLVLRLRLWRRLSLAADRRAYASDRFCQIAFNVLPHIDTFQHNGYRQEEIKMVWKTRMILKRGEFPVNPTTVRMPVFHAIRRRCTSRPAKSCPRRRHATCLQGSRGSRCSTSPATGAALNSVQIAERLIY